MTGLRALVRILHKLPPTIRDRPRVEHTPTLFRKCTFPRPTARMSRRLGSFITPTIRIRGPTVHAKTVKTLPTGLVLSFARIPLTDTTHETPGTHRRRGASVSRPLARSQSR